MSDRIRVLWFDDDIQNRDVMGKALADEGIDVVGRAATEPEMLALVRTVPFDVAILDVLIGRDPRYLGLRIARWMIRYMPEVGVLVYTNHDSEHHAAQLFTVDEANPPLTRSGGIGYRVKFRTTDLAAEIRQVHVGETVLDGLLAAAALARAGKQHRSELTPRETDVLRLLSMGYSNAGIAEKLDLRLNTVEKNLTSVFGKLHLPEGRNRRVTAAGRYLSRAEYYRRLNPVPLIDWPPPAP